MTPEYRARRAAKHAAQAAAKVLSETFPVVGTEKFTIDLTAKAPRLAWLGGKLFKSSSGGRKCRSGYSLEHSLANSDNKNPYLGADGKWFWMDDEGVPNDQSYVTREQAEIALTDYRDTMPFSQRFCS
jgi:hypothetical protein